MMKREAQIAKLVLLAHGCREISIQKANGDMQILLSRLLLDISRVGNDRFNADDCRT
ncbi:hypothetical protein D3C87_1776170 [compost metagenome]